MIARAKKKTIVAEITKTWRNGVPQQPGLLSAMFEEVISVNADQGYTLREFRFNQIAAVDGNNSCQLLETIIAVFDLTAETDDA